MKHTRIVVTHSGRPEALQVNEGECPGPKNGQVRVRVLAAGVSLPDVMMREGVHPETPRLPFTPGWDLIGVVDRLGHGTSGLEPVQRGQRVLIHGAAGGVGSALLRLGRLAGLELYGTCSLRDASVVSALGGIPIDYRQLDSVEEIHRLAREGVDVVFDGRGGAQIWRSRSALCPGGTVVAYGLTSSLRGGRVASVHSGRRHQQQKIAPLIAQRFPLAEARQAHELLGKGGVTGKIVLVSNGSTGRRSGVSAA